ncbi:MAG TPA: protein-L-isoaspartate(D-aspartate) O-methyltransferase [Planctomycetota bacterium]|nr:protein-L-isoaspartate(D-aspartate) O-methyltransferase [Planctomycetota bacterium]
MASRSLPAVLLGAVAAGCGGPDPRPSPPAPTPAGVDLRERPAFPGQDPRDGALARAREEMVQRSLRDIGVTDARVLDAMRAVPRERFVPDALRHRAYDDTPLPIGEGQTISAPDVVGFMSQALKVPAGAKVLDVGTGSGYQAAVLDAMGCRVFSIEILPGLAASAATRLKALGYERVRVRAGDGYLGWPEEAPFDAILVAAAPDHIPRPLVEQLKPGGRLILPVGPDGGVQSLVVVTKREDGTVEEEEVLAVRFVPMTREKK